MEAHVAMSPSPENSGAPCSTLGAVVARVAQCSQVLLVLWPKIDQLRSSVSFAFHCSIQPDRKYCICIK